jgi:hypothetical protein
MKQFCIFVAVFFIVGLFTVNAADLIILKDGNMIEAKIMEIHPGEIRYKRADNLNGPTIVIPKDKVLSIKYENGVQEIINASPATDGAGSSGGQQLGAQTPLQGILNALPAIPIAGNNLKFQFGGDNWVATVNGENFSAGTIELETTDDVTILTLKQTHIWPGAVGKTAGRIATKIPGGGAVGGALNAAGSIAGAVGPVEAPGPVIVLEYKAGPPAKLSYLKSASERSTRTASGSSSTQIAGDHPFVAENRFDLDGFNVFALSINVMPTFWWGIGGGITLTLFESYKPDVFFTPSYFLSGNMKSLGNVFLGASGDGDNGPGGYDSRREVTAVHDMEDVGGVFIALGAGALFKHRFPGNRVLWNVGASLEFMWVSARADVGFDYTYQLSNGSGGYYTGTGTGNAEYRNNHESDNFSFLFGVGIQTGFSFRFNPYTSLDLNGLLKFPFGTVDMGLLTGSTVTGLPSSKEYWPFTGGIELGLTLWFPYRSRGQK